MTQEWTWPADKLYQSLCIVFDENDDIPWMQRNIAKRRLKKLYKRGDLHFDNLDPEWVWRLACAELMQHRYNWLGWERRSKWCWELSTLAWFYKRWDGTPKKLLCLAEQGIGDEILFASCYPDLLMQNPDTTIEVDDRLIPVMERSFGDHFTTRYRKSVFGERDPFQNNDYRGNYEAFIPCGNVPKLYRHKVSDFPRKAYLRTDHDSVLAWKHWLSMQGPGPYVGVSWKGSNTRELDPEDLISGTAINLQYNDTHESLIQPPIDLKEDVDEVFALVKALDLVNCCPVWVLHVAGSVGTPCNVIRAPKVYGVENNLMRFEFGQWDRMDWYDVELFHGIEDFKR